MFKIILNILNPIFNFFLKKLKFIRSFSQEGEDLIIDRIFKKNNILYKEIYYLDIGAGHPIKYSNTFYFYIRGAKGISIDAFKKNIQLHKIFRPVDISLNLLIGNENKLINYYYFSQSELNTTSQERIEELKKHNIFSNNTNIVDQTSVRTLFEKILKKEASKVNFFNIDIEGGEPEVLNNIDWEIFKPNIICAEIISDNMRQVYEHDTYKLLISKGYEVYSKLYNSVIFKKNLN